MTNENLNRRLTTNWDYMESFLKNWIKFPTDQIMRMLNPDRDWSVYPLYHRGMREFFINILSFVF